MSKLIFSQIGRALQLASVCIGVSACVPTNTAEPTDSSSSAISSSSLSSSAQSSSPIGNSELELVVAINAGSNQAALFEGEEYQADQYSRGGTSHDTEDTISGASDDELFQTERYGNYSYQVPLIDATYTVVLHFAELYWEESGGRTFDVALEGSNKIHDLDLYSLVGHDGAYSYTVDGIRVSDGLLDITLAGSQDFGTLSGFAIYSSDGGAIDETYEPPGFGGLPAPANFGLAAGHTKFLGNIWNGSDIGSAQRQSDYTKLWNQVTLENNAKWNYTESSRDNMNFSAVEAAYNWAIENDAMYRHHVFVWGSQEPNWIGNLSQAEQRAEVEEQMIETCTRFPNIHMIDVVNEPLHAPASYRVALGGSGSTGWDWIIWSFEKARQHCPRSALGLNDYNIVNDSSKMNSYMGIVNLLHERGLIDTVGVQFHHFSVRQMSASSTKAAIDRLAAPGLPVVIEEFDVENNQGRQKYEELFPVMWEHPAVAGVTIWGQRKNETWRQQHSMGVLTSSGGDAPEMQFLRSYFGQ